MVIRAGQGEAYRMALTPPCKVIWGLLVIILWVWLFNQFKNCLYSYLEPWHISHLSPTYFKRWFVTCYVFVTVLTTYFITHTCFFVGFQESYGSWLIVSSSFSGDSIESLCVGNENLIPLLKPPIWLCISSQFWPFQISYITKG